MPPVVQLFAGFHGNLAHAKPIVKVVDLKLVQGTWG